MIYHNSYKKKSLSRVLKTFSHYQQVNFAFYCAKDVETLANDPRIIDCNLAVERWLKGDQSVDLELARNNAWNVWGDVTVAYTVYSATAYSAASCISCIVSAASTTSNASNATTCTAATASDAKSYNLYPNDTKQRNVVRNQFYKEYKQIAQNWLSLWNIPNFPKESDFPIFDYLQDYNLISYLLPKKEGYYYLNLNGFNIKHENEAELLKLIDTIHIKNIIRRIINNAET